MTGFWTAERIEALTRMWRQGMAGSQIARELGAVSRHAVSGKIAQLGLTRQGGSDRLFGASLIHRVRLEIEDRFTSAYDGIPDRIRPYHLTAYAALAAAHAHGDVEKAVRYGGLTPELMESTLRGYDRIGVSLDRGVPTEWQGRFARECLRADALSASLRMTVRPTR